jgi:hypothetical protein
VALFQAHRLELHCAYICGDVSAQLNSATVDSFAGRGAFQTRHWLAFVDASRKSEVVVAAVNVDGAWKLTLAQVQFRDRVALITLCPSWMELRHCCHTASTAPCRPRLRWLLEGFSDCVPGHDIGTRAFSGVSAAEAGPRSARS